MPLRRAHFLMVRLNPHCGGIRVRNTDYGEFATHAAGIAMNTGPLREAREGAAASKEWEWPDGAVVLSDPGAVRKPLSQ